MPINSKKIINLQLLSDDARNDYFVRKITDFELVWGLHEKGWATALGEGIVAIPFWPEPEFAELCATGDWSHHSAKPIPLIDYLSKWLPGMHTDKRMCLVFPTPHNRGTLISPERMRQLIENELQQYK